MAVPVNVLKDEMMEKRVEVGTGELVRDFSSDRNGLVLKHRLTCFPRREILIGMFLALWFHCLRSASAASFLE